MGDTHSQPFQLKRVSQARVFESAVEQIRELILKGSIAPGEKLPTELELGKQLKVSRSSVREALRVLEAEGFIDVRRGYGTFVADQPIPCRLDNELAYWLLQREETFEQVLQVREYIEGLAASQAAVHAIQQDIDAIRKIHDEQAEKISKLFDEDEKTEQLATLDLIFHQSISGLCGNDIVNEIVSHMLPAFIEGNKALLYLSHRAPKMIDEHREILIALENRDSASAEKAMRKHIQKVYQELVFIKQKRQNV